MATSNLLTWDGDKGEIADGKRSHFYKKHLAEYCLCEDIEAAQKGAGGNSVAIECDIKPNPINSAAPDGLYNVRLANPKHISVELRATTPTGTRDNHGHGFPKIYGMGEFFDPPDLNVSDKALNIMVCSPWVDEHAIAALSTLIGKFKKTRLFLLTMQDHDLAHKQKILNALNALVEKKNAFDYYLATLPGQKKQKNIPIGHDALHAKIYSLIESEDVDKEVQATQVDTDSHLGSLLNGSEHNPFIFIESFFGSANFTSNGTHCEQTGSPNGYNEDEKWEIVARAADDEAKKEVFRKFLGLWKLAGKLQKKDNPNSDSEKNWLSRPSTRELGECVREAVKRRAEKASKWVDYSALYGITIALTKQLISNWKSNDQLQESWENAQWKEVINLLMETEDIGDAVASMNDKK